MARIKTGDLIGIPFVHGGRTLDGLDCYGLVMELIKREYGVDVPETRYAPFVKDMAAVVAGELPKWKEVDGAKAGSVVLFRIKGLASHVGFMLDEYRFIHTWEKSGGVVIEPISTWEQRVVGYYKFEG